MNFNPTDEQWEKMKKHMKSDKLKKEDFFVFETRAVGDRVVPNRYTRLMPELLQVMKEDAQKGVSLMLNHNWSQLGVQSVPIGKVFDARIGESSQDGETVSLYTTQYIPRDDSKVDGYSKNDIIKLIETGVLSDTSVGFTAGSYKNYKCSICGNSIYSSKCEHIPGQKYIVNEDTNETRLCVAEIHKPADLSEEGNNVLIENSLVFDGAYPNAVIQSKIMNEDKSLSSLKPLENKQELSENDVIIGYTTNNNVSLLYKKSDEKGGVENMDKTKATETNPTSEVNEEETEENLNVTENVNNVDSTDTTENVDNVDNNVDNNTESNSTEVENEEMFTEKDILQKFENIADNLDSLVELAKEGLENRKIVIQEALDSGVHSMGNMFNKEIFTKTFSSMKTKDIKEMGKVWEEQAKTKFSDEKISKENFENKKQDKEEFKVDMNQFKTLNY